MKTLTLLLTGALALGVSGAAVAAVNTCAAPAHKAVHRLAAYHARRRPEFRRTRVLASGGAATYAEAEPPVGNEREYVGAAYPPPVYEGPAYYPAPYAYGPVVYGGPYWGGYGWHGGRGHWRR